jgi:hypothetical protein
MNLKPYPSMTRFMAGTLGVGLALGVTWTIAMTSDWMQQHITKPHAYMILYAASGFLMGMQIRLLHKWRKQQEAAQRLFDDMLGKFRPELDTLTAKVKKALNERYTE